jgi:prepilin signal peptidase PulO-like enzyme (type II secretory pathway)
MPRLSLPSTARRERRDKQPLLDHHQVATATVAVGLAATAFVVRGFGAGGFIAAFMTAVLVLVAATDLERRVIPNRVILPATAVVLCARVALFPSHALEFVLAAAGAATVFLIPNLINRSLMGMGDVKLALFLGAGLGVSVLAAITIAFVSVFPVAVAMLIAGGKEARKSTLPFGPFLATGGIVVLFLPGILGLAGS